MVEGGPQVLHHPLPGQPGFRDFVLCGRSWLRAPGWQDYPGRKDRPAGSGEASDPLPGVNMQTAAHSGHCPGMADPGFMLCVGLVVWRAPPHRDAPPAGYPGHWRWWRLLLLLLCWEPEGRSQRLLSAFLVFLLCSGARAAHSHALGEGPPATTKG